MAQTGQDFNTFVCTNGFLAGVVIFGINAPVIIPRSRTSAS